MNTILYLSHSAVCCISDMTATRQLIVNAISQLLRCNNTNDY